MVIIDDVISAGTSVRESVALITANGATPAGVLIALDRMEKGGDAVNLTATSAAQDVETTFNMPVVSIANLKDLLSFMDGDSRPTANSTARKVFFFQGIRVPQSRPIPFFVLCIRPS